MVYFNSPKDLKNLQTALIIYKRRMDTENQKQPEEVAKTARDEPETIGSPTKKIKS
jgi:hypothetical protein